MPQEGSPDAEIKMNPPLACLRLTVRQQLCDRIQWPRQSGFVVREHVRCW
jgi:hypothetical protein